MSKECGHYYTVSNGRHCLVVIEGEEVKAKPLCNFVGWITDEVTRDDGTKVSKEFFITGGVGGLQLPEARVLSKDFDKLAWVRDQW